MTPETGILAFFFQNFTPKQGFAQKFTPKSDRILEKVPYFLRMVVFDTLNTIT